MKATRWRPFRLIAMALLTLAALVSLAGWTVGRPYKGWNISPAGLQSGLRSDAEPWSLMGTFGDGWLCAALKIHSRPAPPPNWTCGGPGSVPYDGTSRSNSCLHEGELSWPLPIPGRWFLEWRQEEEPDDWLVCSVTDGVTTIHDVSTHSERLHVRGLPSAWLTPGRSRTHLDVWFAVPFWALTLVTGAIPAYRALRWFYRRKFRYRDGECKKCGYNLTGNVTGVCPECGSNLPPRTITSLTPPDGHP